MQPLDKKALRDPADSVLDLREVVAIKQDDLAKDERRPPLGNDLAGERDRTDLLVAHDASVAQNAAGASADFARATTASALARGGRAGEWWWPVVLHRASQEMDMPLINVKVIEGVFDADEKRRIVTRLTDAMVEIEGENMRPVTWVIVEEVLSGDWGIAGNPMRTEDVKALAAGAPVGA